MEPSGPVLQPAEINFKFYEKGPQTPCDRFGMMVWYDMVWYGMSGMIWYGMRWYGMV
ncbi:hypothetical protein K443DRAFT_92197 [Laccaria amethystina LaAM-08-1]|uniref:Uncharacterized protein n=1 Tax=Laccaria amethystina LaAM-08-1 TaxID=1095629 RepID=A0A0C9WYL1_9AGAR|nr:hypothetical protein K443DRAFT_92197 [Laccaria amethystina LaAM-08-1]